MRVWFHPQLTVQIFALKLGTVHKTQIGQWLISSSSVPHAKSSPSDILGTATAYKPARLMSLTVVGSFIGMNSSQSSKEPVKRQPEVPDPLTQNFQSSSSFMFKILSLLKINPKGEVHTDRGGKIDQQQFLKASPIMDFFRYKLMNYDTDRQLSTLLHIHVQTDRPKVLIPPSKSKNYVDEMMKQYEVKMYDYPDLTPNQKQTAFNIHLQRKNLFHVDEVKRRANKKKHIRKSLQHSPTLQRQKSCPCCGAKQRHKCEHIDCQKPCSRMKRARADLSQSDFQDKLSAKKEMQDEDEEELQPEMEIEAQAEKLDQEMEAEEQKKQKKKSESDPEQKLQAESSSPVEKISEGSRFSKGDIEESQYNSSFDNQDLVDESSDDFLTNKDRKKKIVEKKRKRINRRQPRQKRGRRRNSKATKNVKNPKKPGPARRRRTKKNEASKSDKKNSDLQEGQILKALNKEIKQEPLKQEDEDALDKIQQNKQVKSKEVKMEEEPKVEEPESEKNKEIDAELKSEPKKGRARGRTRGKKAEGAVKKNENRSTRKKKPARRKPKKKQNEGDQSYYASEFELSVSSRKRSRKKKEKPQTQNYPELQKSPDQESEAKPSEKLPFETYCLPEKLLENQIFSFKFHSDKSPKSESKEKPSPPGQYVEQNKNNGDEEIFGNQQDRRNQQLVANSDPGLDHESMQRLDRQNQLFNEMDDDGQDLQSFVNKHFKKQ